MLVHTKKSGLQVIDCIGKSAIRNPRSAIPTQSAIRNPQSAIPPGFTLVEVLVVISIIAVLTALTAGSVFKVLEGQKKSNTEQTLRTLGNALKQQWQEVVRKARQEVPPSQVLTLAGNDPARAQVIWVKLRLNQEFPMSFAEAFGLGPPLPGAPPPLYVGGLAKLGITKPNGTTQPYESAILLLLALQRTRGGSRVNADAFGTATANMVLSDKANGNITVRLFADGWGTPLAFFRWPTGYPEMDGSNPAPSGTKASVNRDPLDPEGALINPAWYASLSRTQFEAGVHSLSITPPGALKPQPYSCYMVPVVASAGGNEQWGIKFGSTGATSNMAATPPGNNLEADNLYSFRLRLSATGD